MSAEIGGPAKRDRRYKTGRHYIVQISIGFAERGLNMLLRSFSGIRTVAAAVTVALLISVGLYGKKFYGDDPIEKMPPPMPVAKVNPRKLSDIYDLFANTFGKPGERHQKGKVIPARAVNTLGEVPDSEWYTNRHYQRRMSIDELVRGPGNENPPDTRGPLTIVSAKTEGVMPGFVLRDRKGHVYHVKFDPLSNPEMATAADVVVAKFFYALGYNVPENYIFTFSRQQLEIAPGTTLAEPEGRQRPMRHRDVTDMMLNVPRGPDARYRGSGSFALAGKSVRAFRYHGTRKDDPNDIVPHEHRRDLRGLRVFCAWLGHDDSKALNTLDMLTEENGVRFVKHYLIDFGASLGSDSNWPNSPRSGYEYRFAWKPTAEQFFTLGLLVPRWARAKYPKIAAAGRLEAEVFDPDRWVPFYTNPAFVNCLPDDAFWAAKQVMAFTDDEIRAILKTGQYTDPRAEDWIAECLIKRRDKIGKAFFARVLPLDRFAVKDGRLVFEDLAVKHGLISSHDYTVEWSRFNNDTEQNEPLPGQTTLALPQQLREASAGEYFAARIHGGDKQKAVTVYLRRKMGEVEVVGVDRAW